MRENIPAVLTWGFVVGFALMPAVKYGMHAFTFLFAAALSRIPAGSHELRAFVSLLLGACLSVTVFGGFVIGGNWLLGMQPLRGAFQLWSFALIVGAVVYKLVTVYVERKKRSSQ